MSRFVAWRAAAQKYRVWHRKLRQDRRTSLWAARTYLRAWRTK